MSLLFEDNKKTKNEISMVIFVMFFGVLVINNFLVLSLIVKKNVAIVLFTFTSYNY